MELSFPGHEEQTISVRVQQAYKSSAPSFVARLADLNIALLQFRVKLVDITDAQHKVHSAPAFQHRFKLLDKRYAQRTCAHRSHRWLRLVIARFNFES